MSSGLRSYFWLLLSAPVGELHGEFYQSPNDRAAQAAAECEAELSLPRGVHTIVVSGIRGNGEAYVVWRGDVVIGTGAVACA